MILPSWKGNPRPGPNSVDVGGNAPISGAGERRFNPNWPPLSLQSLQSLTPGTDMKRIACFATLAALVTSYDART
jgi:hypothetical protein